MSVIDPDRARLRDLWLASIQFEPQIHYVQDRPMKTIARYKGRGPSKFLADLRAGLKLSADCSEWVTLMCMLSGWQDPNGLHFNGAGNTETMFRHLPHYSDPRNAGIGAIALFGMGAALQHQHACSVLVPGEDPLLGSHGQDKGPLEVRWSVEVKVHPVGDPVFCNVQGLLP